MDKGWINHQRHENLKPQHGAMVRTGGEGVGGTVRTSCHQVVDHYHHCHLVVDRPTSLLSLCDGSFVCRISSQFFFPDSFCLKLSIIQGFLLIGEPVIRCHSHMTSLESHEPDLGPRKTFQDLPRFPNTRCPEAGTLSHLAKCNQKSQPQGARRLARGPTNRLSASAPAASPRCRRCLLPSSSL